jgi:phosphoribosylformylglycinamidine cyclo-ligase
MSVVPELGVGVGEALLVPHRSYLRVIGPLVGERIIKGMAHITGGGITDNLPRILPDGTHAVIDRHSWTVPPIFRWLQSTGDVPDQDMLRTFNMGVGLIMVCAEDHAATMVSELGAFGEPGALILGRVCEGGDGVTYVVN